MDEQYTLIEDYLLGKLSDTERHELEERLRTDPPFAAAFQQQQLEHDAMELLLERNLRDKMAQWEQDKPGKYSANTWWMIGVATAVLLLGGLWWFWWRPAPAQNIPVEKPVTTPPAMQVPSEAAPAPATTDSNSMAQQTGKPDRRLIAMAEQQYSDDLIRNQLRGGAGQSDSLNEWYRNRQYRPIVNATNALDMADNNYLRQLELRAHALFHLKKYKEAAAAFEILANSKKEPFAERSDWYLLLSLAAQGEAARKPLQVQYAKISQETDHAFYKKTKDLRLDLK